LRIVTTVRAPLVVLIVALPFALALGFTARALDNEPLQAASGVVWVVAVVAAIMLLPWWNRIIPPVPAMPGLFARVGPQQRWCTRCGTPAPKQAACPVCGHTPRLRRRRRKPAAAEPDGQIPPPRKPRRS